MKKYFYILSIFLLILLALLIFYFSNLTFSKRTIPIPDTVSPQMQTFFRIPVYSLGSLVTPADTTQWRLFINKTAELAIIKIEEMQKQLSMNIEYKNIHGVNTYIISPAYIPANNKNKLLINMHGGGYILLPGKSGLMEGLLMAHYAKMKVIAIDYRMPPDFPFPAALEDTLTVYREIIKSYSPNHIALFGTSAGGGLAAATVLKLKELKLPLPAALALITPWSDLSKTGDTYFTNDGIDNVISHYSGSVEAAAKLYANHYDLKHPLISPIYGDMSNFPPTILISGTRDLLLSCTVRMHRKLRQQGIEAELDVFEAMPHAFQILNPEAPESKEAWLEIADFFHKKLDNQ